MLNREVAKAMGIDDLHRVEHYGRYTAKVAVELPAPMWATPRYRVLEVDCPLMAWSIGGKRFRGVVPVTFTPNGDVDDAAMEKAFARMINESREASKR